MTSPVVGVDIGGTKIAVGRVSAAGELHSVQRHQTPARHGAKAILDVVMRAVEDLRAEGMVSAVGVSTGGVVDHRSGVIVEATDLISDWAGCRVSEVLSAELGLPVRVDNDGNCLALAQIRLGVTAPTTLCVAVGTGIGGGVIVDGALIRGRRFLGGDFGHLPAETDLTCSCGRAGHLEAVASGSALAARYSALAGSARHLTDVSSDLGSDPLAAQVVKDGARALGRALSGPVLTLDADLVIVGGGVAEIGIPYLAAVEDALQESLPHGRRVGVRSSSGGEHAAVIGAASLMETS